MNVLVTGGTGFVGTALLPLLAKHRVIVPTRQQRTSTKHVRYVHGDITDPVFLKRVLTKVDAVIHLAAVIKSPMADEFERVNVRGTHALVRACEHRKIKRFIFVSSYLADERFTSAYARSKRNAEAIVTASAVPWIILRPTQIYGAQPNALTFFVKLVKTLPVIPVPAGKLRPILVFDVARAIVRALEVRANLRTYILAGEETVTTAKIVKRIACALNKKRIIIPLPVWVSKCAAVLIEPFLPTVTSSLRHIYQLPAFSLTQTKRDLGWRPTPFDARLLL